MMILRSHHYDYHYHYDLHTYIHQKCTVSTYSTLTFYADQSITQPINQPTNKKKKTLSLLLSTTPFPPPPISPPPLLFSPLPHAMILYCIGLDCFYIEKEQKGQPQTEIYVMFVFSFFPMCSNCLPPRL